MRPTSDRRLRRAAVSVAAALALAGCGAGGGSAAAQLLDDDPDWEYSPDTTECVITHVRSQIDDSNEVSAGDLVASMTAGRADETGVGLDRCVSDAERLWTATQIGMEANAEDDCSVQQIAEMLDLNVRTVLNMAGDGRLPASRLAGSRKFHYVRDQIIDTLIANTVVPETPASNSKATT